MGGPVKSRSPGSTGVIGPAPLLFAVTQTGTCVSRSPFDIEMPFLQYVVFCIIETANAFSDRRVYLFCSSLCSITEGACMQTVYVYTQIYICYICVCVCIYSVAFSNPILFSAFFFLLSFIPTTEFIYKLLFILVLNRTTTDK